MLHEKPFDDALRDLTVLVTGHTGFKGSWLSIWLKLLGANVVGYSRDPTIATKIRNFQLCHLDQRMTHLVGDIRDLDALKVAIETHKPRLVIHMAAQALVNVSYQEPKRTCDTNVGGTVNILEAIRRTPFVKAFIGVTTDKVYEDQRWVWGYRESDPLGGYDPYSASKAMAELAIQSYRRSWLEKWTHRGEEKWFSENSAAIASVRAGNVIGGGDFSKYRLMPDCMKALLDGKPISLRSPDAVRPWQHVLEPLSGYLWLAANLLKPNTANVFSDAWNFGPPVNEAITCETVAQKAIAVWGSGSYKPLTTTTPKSHETSILKLNWVKAATSLEWRPTLTWERAVEATVDWFKEYQAKGGASSTFPQTIDMYQFCCDQIKQYMADASAQGIGWA